MTSAHEALHHATIEARAQAALTPHLMALMDGINANLTALDNLSRKTARQQRTAHVALRHKAAVAAITEGYTALGTHIAAQLPPHWGMDGWNIRFSASSQQATWAATQGRGQHGVSIAPTPQALGHFVGFMLGTAYQALSCEAFHEAQQWASIAPMERSDWTFALHDRLDGFRALSHAPGRNPRDALLAKRAKTLDTSASHATTTRDEAYKAGFVRVDALQREPLIWSGAHLLWGDTVQSPAGKRLLGGSKATPDEHRARLHFADYARFCAEVRTHTTTAPQARAQDWQQTFMRMTQRMQVFADLAKLSEPLGKKEHWVVTNFDDPNTPIVMHAQGWSSTSAILHAALRILHHDKEVADISTWQAWPFAPQGETKTPEVRASLAKRLTAR